MKQLISALSSMNTMVIMMLIFAAAIGYATFIENDYGTMTAKADVFNALWFELLMALLSINLMFNIYKYKMFSVKKAPIFIFHLSFLIIVLGAAITRFVGFEGTMHIREGEIELELDLECVQGYRSYSPNRGIMFVLSIFDFLFPPSQPIGWTIVLRKK